MFLVWDFIGFFFWSFVVIATLATVFVIIGDVIRDSKLAGWTKALWILFLIVVPIVSAVIYVIARGPSLVERQRARDIGQRSLEQ